MPTWYKPRRGNGNIFNCIHRHNSRPNPRDPAWLMYFWRGSGALAFIPCCHSDAAQCLSWTHPFSDSVLPMSNKQSHHCDRRQSRRRASNRTLPLAEISQCGGGSTKWATIARVGEAILWPGRCCSWRPCGLLSGPKSCRFGHKTLAEAGWACNQPRRPRSSEASCGQHCRRMESFVRYKPFLCS